MKIVHSIGRFIIFFSAIIAFGALVYGVFFASVEEDQVVIQEAGDTLWDLDLEVSQVSIEGTNYASSAKLRVSWNEDAPDEVTSFRVEVTDLAGGTLNVLEIPSTNYEVFLTGLKSGTAYSVYVSACANNSCNQVLGQGEERAYTEEEYWQIFGEGAGYEEVDQVIQGASTLSYVMPYGDWAPEVFQGLTKFYYNAMPDEANNDEGGMRVASTEDRFLIFEDLKALILRECQHVPNPSVAGSTDDDCPEEQLDIFAFQAIPLVSGVVRLFFEASSPSDPNHITQIYSLDSQDGYVGEDFDPDPDSDVCGDTDEHEFLPGGGCEPLLLIGSSEKFEGAFLKHARQFKIGYPKIDSELWDEADGSFMVITGQDACDQTRDGLFYAVLGDNEWTVNSFDGCAVPLVLDAHGPVLVHMGGLNYKLYYENYEYSDRERGIFDSKPLRVIYANGSGGRNSEHVEFVDWEVEDVAREVHFLWPDGTVLTDEEEAGLGDHMIWLPNNDLEIQQMHMNLGGFDNKEWSRASAGLGTAVLINP